MRKYINGDLVEVGDVFTDGGENQEDIRLRIRGKVLYVDKFTVVWMPLNKYTINLYASHFSSKISWFRYPRKLELSDLTQEELEMYNNSDSYLK